MIGTVFILAKWIFVAYGNYTTVTSALGLFSFLASDRWSAMWPYVRWVLDLAGLLACLWLGKRVVGIKSTTGLLRKIELFMRTIVLLLLGFNTVGIGVNYYATFRPPGSVELKDATVVDSIFVEPRHDDLSKKEMAKIETVKEKMSAGDQEAVDRIVHTLTSELDLFQHSLLTDKATALIDEVWGKYAPEDPNGKQTVMRNKEVKVEVEKKVAQDVEVKVQKKVERLKRVQSTEASPIVIKIEQPSGSFLDRLSIRFEGLFFYVFITGSIIAVILWYFWPHVNPPDKAKPPIQPLQPLVPLTNPLDKLPLNDLSGKQRGGDTSLPDEVPSKPKPSLEHWINTGKRYDAFVPLPHICGNGMLHINAPEELTNEEQRKELESYTYLMHEAGDWGEERSAAAQQIYEAKQEAFERLIEERSKRYDRKRHLVGEIKTLISRSKKLEKPLLDLLGTRPDPQPPEWLKNINDGTEEEEEGEGPEPIAPNWLQSINEPTTVDRKRQACRRYDKRRFDQARRREQRLKDRAERERRSQKQNERAQNRSDKREVSDIPPDWLKNINKPTIEELRRRKRKKKERAGDRRSWDEITPEWLKDLNKGTVEDHQQDMPPNPNEGNQEGDKPSDRQEKTLDPQVSAPQGIERDQKERDKIDEKNSWVNDGEKPDAKKGRRKKITKSTFKKLIKKKAVLLALVMGIPFLIKGLLNGGDWWGLLLKQGMSKGTSLVAETVTETVTETVSKVLPTVVTEVISKATPTRVSSVTQQALPKERGWWEEFSERLEREERYSAEPGYC